jgi:general secretion pathway protein A
VQPPESLQALADPIYEAFYGLREQPFAISTDPKFLFLSSPHRRAYDELRTGLLRDESLVLLTGETGSGKTTLCRGVIGSLGDRTFSSILHQPYMTGPEMLRLILRDFGLVSREELRRGVLAGADVPQLLDVLESFLRSLVAIESRAIVVLDEAQSLSPTLLDEVRMLTAFERDGKRLVQIVMCGQPMLLNTLKTEPMYALNERITRRVALMPLSRDEVEAYINHRLTVAGGAPTVSFQGDAIHLIAELSRGLPRRVNVLCDRTLQEGRIEGAMSITAALVKRAAKALAGQHPAGGAVLGSDAEGPAGDVIPADDPIVAPSRPPWRIAAVAGALVLAGVAAYHLYARSVLTGDLGVPDAPAPVAAEAPGALPLPTAAEVDLLLKELASRPGGG